MVKRNIVNIDEDKCNGCGQCVPSCKEGALQIINGKAKLISDIYCDGLGACLGNCPQGAITIEEREAGDFDEIAVAKHLIKNKNDEAPLPCGCPGTMARTINNDSSKKSNMNQSRNKSELKNWPIQLKLVPPAAPYLKGADIIFLADCTGFACPNIHQDFIRNRVAIIACPKLDDTKYYLDKLTEMIKINNFRTIEAVMMEVPCCRGLGQLLEQAASAAGSGIQVKQTIISLEGEPIK